MINNNKLHIIKWIDSYNAPGVWEEISEMQEPKSMICVSVGWIEKETKDNIIIIPHISDIDNKENKGHACGAMTIPKVAILKRIKLKCKL
jgi:hypothetical protein